MRQSRGLRGIHENPTPKIFAMSWLLLMAHTACLAEASRDQSGRVQADSPEWFTPGAEYRIDTQVAPGTAWATSAIQTPTPLTTGVRHLHVADSNRSWATALPVATSLGYPMTLSPDDLHLASVGADGEVKASAPLRIVLHVLRLDTGKVVRVREAAHGVIHLGWLDHKTLLICENPNRMRPGPAKFILSRMDVGTGQEAKIVEFPLGTEVIQLIPETAGRYVVGVETQGRADTATLAVYQLSDGSRRSLPLLKGMGTPVNVSCWPDGALYFESGGKPYRMSLALDSTPQVLKGFPEKPLEGSIAPDGGVVLAAIPDMKSLQIVDLKSGQSAMVGSIKAERGPFLRNVTWSKSGRLAAGWMGIVRMEAGFGGRKAVLSWFPFILNSSERKIAFFRANEHPQPVFIIESRAAVEALKEKAVSWR